MSVTGRISELALGSGRGRPSRLIAARPEVRVRWVAGLVAVVEQEGLDRGDSVDRDMGHAAGIRDASGSGDEVPGQNPSPP